MLLALCRACCCGGCEAAPGARLVALAAANCPTRERVPGSCRRPWSSNFVFIHCFVAPACTRRLLLRVSSFLLYLPPSLLLPPLFIVVSFRFAAARCLLVSSLCHSCSSWWFYVVLGCPITSCTHFEPRIIFLFVNTLHSLSVSLSLSLPLSLSVSVFISLPPSLPPFLSPALAPRSLFSASSWVRPITPSLPPSSLCSL